MPGSARHDREHGEDTVGAIDLHIIDGPPPVPTPPPLRAVTPDDLPPAAQEVVRAPARPSPRRDLKNLLIATDATALSLALASALAAQGYVGDVGVVRAAAVVAVATGIGLLAVRSQGLFLARISAVRVVEMTRITRAMVILTAAGLAADRLLRLDLPPGDIVVATVASTILLVVGRSAYRRWLGAARARGQHCRRMIVMGGDAEAKRLIEVFETHPDLGIRIVGVVGDEADVRREDLGELWLGDFDAAEEIVERAGASGVVLLPTAIPPARLNPLVRALQLQRVHIHLATGVSGIDGRRIRSLPLAYEPLLYVEPLSLGRMQVAVKRVFDIVLATVALIVASPLLLVVAVGIKLDDGGPVLFRQERVGFGGRTFGLLKFRSMRVGADKQLTLLRETNERQGPLFKMVDDPRVTRFGRFLRQSSLDELPQLFNVLRGQMSLVGPRPALPAEVAHFPASLRARENVMPGITGLWQVEARDNPSFEAYRRLDLFYVENWSTTLDLLIIVATLEHCIERLASTLGPRPRVADGADQRG